MSKRMLFAAVALGFVLAACGRESYDTLDVRRSTTPTPRATSTPRASATPIASVTPGPTATAPGVAPTQAPSAEVPQAPEGKVNRPKAGRYVYDLTGEATNPSNPAGPPQKFPDGSQTVSKMSHQDNVTTEEQTNTAEAGRQVTKTRWESSKVSLVSVSLDTQVGTFSCKFDPPIVIIHIPIKAEKFPTQTIKGEGNACTGKVDITVEGKESVKDATGKSWSTWRIKVRTESTSDQVTRVTDEIRWFSPDLGAVIRGQANSTGKFSGFNFSAKSNTVLRSRP